MHPKDRAQMMAYLTRPSMAKGGRIGFQDGKDVRVDAIGRQNTKLMKKEESVKKNTDKIIEKKNESEIREE